MLALKKQLAAANETAHAGQTALGGRLQDLELLVEARAATILQLRDQAAENTTEGQRQGSEHALRASELARRTSHTHTAEHP